MGERVPSLTLSGLESDGAVRNRQNSPRFEVRARRLTAWSLLLAALLVAMGCTPTATSVPPRVAASNLPLTGTLAVGGSTALQPLVEQAARDFQQANPGVQITVAGGGSGAGRTGACQGNLDIGFSDVPLTPGEISRLNCGNPVQTAIAMQAFAVAANPIGPGSLTALNRDQMQAMFSGAVKNWAEIGGANQELTFFNRPPGSGTRQSMANYLFNGDDTLFRRDAVDQDSNETVATTVRNTPGAVSYLGLAYLNDPGLRTLGIQRPDGMVLPTREVVARLQWPIGGPGVAITRGQPSELAAAFLSYVIGPTFESDPAWRNLGYVVPSKPSIGNPIGQ